MALPSVDLILLDLDETLILDTWRAAPEARQVLLLLRTLNIPLVLFSHNGDAKERALQADLFWYKREDDTYACFFDNFACGIQDNDKTWNMEQVRGMYPDIPCERMLLFDDWPAITRAMAHKYGIRTHVVRQSTGITILDVIKCECLLECHEVFGYML